MKEEYWFKDNAASLWKNTFIKHATPTLNLGEIAYSCNHC